MGKFDRFKKYFLSSENESKHYPRTGCHMVLAILKNQCYLIEHQQFKAVSRSLFSSPASSIGPLVASSTASWGRWPSAGPRSSGGRSSPSQRSNLLQNQELSPCSIATPRAWGRGSPAHPARAPPGDPCVVPWRRNCSVPRVTGIEACWSRLVSHRAAM